LHPVFQDCNWQVTWFSHKCCQSVDGSSNQSEIQSISPWSKSDSIESSADKRRVELRCIVTVSARESEMLYSDSPVLTHPPFVGLQSQPATEIKIDKDS